MADKRFEITIRGVSFSASILPGYKPNLLEKDSWNRVSVLADSSYEHQPHMSSDLGDGGIEHSDPVRMGEAEKIMKELTENVEDSEVYKQIKAAGGGVIPYMTGGGRMQINIAPPAEMPAPHEKKWWQRKSTKSAADIPVPATPSLEEQLHAVVVKELKALELKYGPDMPDGAKAVYDESRPIKRKRVVQPASPQHIPTADVLELQKRMEADIASSFRALESVLPEEYGPQITAAQTRLMEKSNAAFNALTKPRELE